MGRGAQCSFCGIFLILQSPLSGFRHDNNDEADRVFISDEQGQFEPGAPMKGCFIHGLSQHGNSLLQ